jgi:hypothetical protein
MRRSPIGLLLPLLLLVPGCDTLPGHAVTDPFDVRVGTSPSPVPKAELTMVVAGDLLVYPALVDQAAADARATGQGGYDFTQVLAGIRPWVRDADLAICHLGTPLADEVGAEPSASFAGPPQLADATAWAGFDTCSTASDHCLATGLTGIGRTLDNLDRVGLGHSGTARDVAEAARPNVLDVSGVRVAQLSYTFGFGGASRAADQAWSANLIDAVAVLDEARRARAAGAEIVVLSLRWGAGYRNEPEEGQLALARELLASPDVDLIVGHHGHVVQPFEKIGAKWVAYGLGNLTTGPPDGVPEAGQGAVVPRFTFGRTASGGWTVTGVEVLVASMEYQPTVRVVDLSTAVDDVRLSAVRRAEYSRVQDRVMEYLDARGARGEGLRMRD